MSTAKFFQNRRNKFLPDGIPKFVRCYDNANEPDASADHFTVVFSGRYRDIASGEGFLYLAMSSRPFHPQGIGQHGESPTQIDAPQGWPPAIGRKCHLGRRIPFSELPRDCQRLVMHDYLGIWDLVAEARDSEIPYTVVDSFVK